MKLKHLLSPDGKVNIDAVRTFLYTFAMTISIYRCGAIRGDILMRDKQLHAPKEKRNGYVLKHCRKLMEEKPSLSAARLMLRFPKGEKNAIVIDAIRIFRELSESGDRKIICIKPNGKRMLPIGERTIILPENWTGV